MALRYQKRISLGKGAGLNVSQSGISASVRTKSGSIGTRGFSIKTGIPGLSYRGGWGKGSPGGVVFLLLIAIAGVVLIVYNLVRLVIYSIVSLYDLFKSRLGRNSGDQ